ncbi:MAG TPA: F0F1 ATP synthase subunit alpha [Anaeromyxobacteraceae bacterium]|nr:F0F1 ATP synthase subunit alpha [Anaeromyxobacteraceae bacterium]
MADPGEARELVPAVPAHLDLGLALRPRGAVAEVGDGVAQVTGLAEVGSEELVIFDSGAVGVAYDLAPEHIGVVVLSGADRVRAGQGARPGGRLPSLPVGRDLLGRLIDPLGRALDDGPPPAGVRRSAFCAAPDLTERAPVNRPLLTGVMVLDAAVPIGRGQRQLIVGDHNVGKTALALDIVAAQRPGEVACVYVAVGQPLTRVLGIRQALLEHGALANTVVVAADAADPAGLQYLAPYAGASVAEYFRDQGQDALVVYDDLTKHADAYRELALLLGRPPGREAFPGDIFFIHAGLLERATARTEAAGGGSVTALPIVETTDGDISSYIPTNLISITDGQVYLDAARFERNQRPAVDVGRSVSRVGGAAQSASMRAAARNLRIIMARFEALEALTRVGLDVDEETRRAVNRGRIMREILRQPRFAARSLGEEIAALTAVAGGQMDGFPPARAGAIIEAIRRARAGIADDMARLDAGEEPAAGWQERLRPALTAALGPAR